MPQPERPEVTRVSTSFGIDSEEDAPAYVRNRAGRILNRDLRCPRGPKRLQRRRSETHAGRVGQTRSDEIAITPLEGTEREELHVDLYVMPATNAG